LEDFTPSSHPLVTVADAISDLPDPIPKNKNSDLGWADYPQTNGLSHYAKKVRKKPKTHQGLPIARTQQKAGKVSGLFDTIHSPEVAKRYKDTKPGSTDPVSRSKNYHGKASAQH